MSRTRTGRWIGGLLAGLVVLGVVGWLGVRGELPWQRPPEPTAVSEEAAVLAEEKLERLQRDGEEVRLSEVELASLVRYRAPVWAVNGVDDPSVSMTEDALVVRGRIATDRLPPHPELDRIRGFLPESSQVEVTGRVRPLSPGRAALEIAEVEFAGIPVPSRYYPEVLSRVGRRDEPGLAPTELALRLPEGARSARIQGGQLILSP